MAIIKQSAYEAKLPRVVKLTRSSYGDYVVARTELGDEVVISAWLLASLAKDVLR